MALLFSELKIRDLVFKNRIMVSPMCQYSAIEGVAQPWHLVHLGSRATGGAALVMAEATGVSPEGRISLQCLGLWNQKQAEAFQPITNFIKSQGSIPAIQLAHAGRKSDVPGTILAPSAIAFSEKYQTPKEMNEADLQMVQEQFKTSAQFALQAGFEVIEIHMAHGYLLNEFLSPLSNTRTDQYGGSFENRIRYPLMIAKELREMWPKKWPVFVRISAVDWVDGGWDLQQSIAFSKELKKMGIDLIDCSSGGSSAVAKVPAAPNYQVPFAEAIRKEVQMMTGAVGLITEAEQAEKILVEGKADAIFLARELLRDPYWPLHAAKKLGIDITWPKQYERAKV